MSWQEGLLSRFLLTCLRFFRGPRLDPLGVETSPSGTQEERLQEPHLKYHFLPGDSPLSLPSQNLLKEEIQHHIYQGAFSMVPASLEPSLNLATDFPLTKLPKSLADATLWNVDNADGWHWRTNSHPPTPRDGNAQYPFLDISGGSHYLLWSPSF